MLWIENEPALMAPLASYLAKEGFDVEFATTGEAGWSMADSTPYDIILLDLKLPDIPGMEFLRRIRSGGIGTPVMVITGFGSIESAVESIRAGAADYKSKPLRAIDLVQAIRSVVASSSREPPKLFLEPRGKGPSAPVGRVLRNLSEIMEMTDLRDVNTRFEARNAVSEQVARALADPQLTLVEFCALTEALRLFSEESGWLRPALEHVLNRIDAASRCDWSDLDDTVREIVRGLILAGKACRHANEETMARELGVEPNRISARLRRELGLSFPQLRRVIVMRRAVQLLAVTDEQVAQIAYAVGYEHPSAFDHAFAGLFSMSPGTYRRLIGG